MGQNGTMENVVIGGLRRRALRVLHIWHLNAFFHNPTFRDSVTLIELVNVGIVNHLSAALMMILCQKTYCLVLQEQYVLWEIEHCPLLTTACRACFRGREILDYLELFECCRFVRITLLLHKL